MSDLMLQPWVRVVVGVVMSAAAAVWIILLIRLAAVLSGAVAAYLTGSLGVLIVGDLVLAHWQRRAP